MNDIYVIKTDKYAPLYCNDRQLLEKFLKAYGSNENEISDMFNGLPGENSFDGYIEISKLKLDNKYFKQWIKEKEGN